MLDSYSKSWKCAIFWDGLRIHWKLIFANVTSYVVLDYDFE